MLDILPKLVHSHAGFAYLSLILLLTRGALSARQINWRQYKILKIAPHIIDTLLLLSGATVVYAYTSEGVYTLSELSWLLGKFLFIVLYVIFSAKAFKKNQPYSIKFYLLSVVSFMIAMFIAVHH